MTELPPIIDRLDAHLAEADTLGQRGHINASRDVLVNVARSDTPELRAELLRLQAERDVWKRLSDTWEGERDALLEALNGFEALADSALSETEPKYLESALRTIAGDAHRAIANVEGEHEQG